MSVSVGSRVFGWKTKVTTTSVSQFQLLHKRVAVSWLVAAFVGVVVSWANAVEQVRG